MKNAKRIVIIGNAGSGKSTLALQLHQKTGLPVYHLDQHYWKSGWVKADPGEFSKKHDEFCNLDEWIIDGTNFNYIAHRLHRAQVIIFLNIPRYKCFWRIFKRVFLNYGRETSSSARGCPERFSWKFLQFLKWVWDFDKKQIPRITKAFSVEGYSLDKKAFEDQQDMKDKEFFILSSQKDVNEFFRCQL